MLSHMARFATSSSQGRADVSAAPARVPWRHVAMFAALAYGISWTVWASAMPEAWHSLEAWKTPTTYAAGSLAMLGMFGPGIAALVMRLFVTKEGVKGSLGTRRSPRFYAVALLGPVVLVSATVAISVAAGLAEFELGTDKPVWQVYLLLLLVGTPISTVLTLGEEYGWRGYLLPKLLPLGELRASLLVALIWAPWHLPILLAGLNYGGETPFAALAFMLAIGIGISLLATRLFVVAGGSVLVVAVAHASFNAFGDRLSDAEHLLGNPLVVSVGGLVGLALMAVAVAVAYRRRGRAGTKARSNRLVHSAEGFMPQPSD